MYRENGGVWTNDFIYTACHCNDKAISLLDDAVNEELLEFHFAARFEDGARVYSCLLNLEWIVVLKDSQTGLLAARLALRVFFSG